MRNLVDVLNTMLSLIPAEEAAFIQDLNNIKDSAEFSSPENIGVWWGGTKEVLEHHMPGMCKDFAAWQFAVAEAWNPDFPSPAKIPSNLMYSPILADDPSLEGYEDYTVKKELVDTIDAIMKMIPGEQTAFAHDWRNIGECIAAATPETMMAWRGIAQTVLCIHLPPKCKDFTEWQTAIAKTWNPKFPDISWFYSPSENKPIKYFIVYEILHKEEILPPLTTNTEIVRDRPITCLGTYVKFKKNWNWNGSKIMAGKR